MVQKREINISKITRVEAKSRYQYRSEREAGAVEEVNSGACPFRSKKGGVFDRGF